MDTPRRDLPSVILGRWFRLNRHSERIGDLVVMAFEAWESMPAGRRPEGKVDDTASLVMIECESGWHPDQ